jgi:putative hydrolase of the HAD superfamily
MIRARVILFDCGDTLVCLDPPKEKIVYDFLRAEGVRVPLDQIKTAYRLVDFCIKQSIETEQNSEVKKEFLITYNAQLLKALGLSLKENLWAKNLHERFRDCRRWVLLPDTISTLQSLEQKGFILGVVANWDENLGRLLNGLGIGRFFRLIVSSRAVNEEKPDPGIIKHALRKLAANPSEAIYVGNEYEVDVIAARRAGVKPILIDRHGFLPYADCLRFGGLSEMAAYLGNR